MRLRRLPAVSTSLAADPAGGVRPRLHPWARAARVASAAAVAAALAGCAAGVGFGIGLAPGLSLNVGVGSGGPSIGLGTGWGPLGAGVSVDGAGRVVGSTGVGVSAGPVGVGLGQAAVLYDPRMNGGPPSVADPAVKPGVVVRRSGGLWRTPVEMEAP